MKIVRAFWGNSRELRKEIPDTPLFEDEVVFVWGNSNYVFLKERGYKVYRVNPNPTESEYSNHLLHYAHKLKALKMADEMFGEYLFLDWDIKIVKPIDDNFYSEIRKGNNIQVPLYAYPLNWDDRICEYLKNDPTQELTPDLEDFIKNQFSIIPYYSWGYENMNVLPCACFIYSNNTSIGTILLDIFKERKLQGCIEEFAIFIMTKCTYEEYLNKYEPTVINGKEYDKKLQEMTDVIVELNSKISKVVNKQIYLHHDTF